MLSLALGQDHAPGRGKGNELGRAEFAEFLDHPVGPVALGNGGRDNQLDARGGLRPHISPLYADNRLRLVQGQDALPDGARVVEDFDGGAVGESQYVAGVVGLGAVEGDRFARTKMWDVDAARHAGDYRDTPTQGQTAADVGPTTREITRGASLRQVGLML